eukprot:4280800-Amphidinium_carterae.1
MLMTILLCINYSYFGSTISPLATARQAFATMATSTTENEEDHIPGAPGTMGDEDARNNPLDYCTSDSGTPSSSTIGYDIIRDMTKIMWSSLVSPQCSPLVHAQLHMSWLVLAWDDPIRDSSTALVRDIIIYTTMAAPIQRNGFNPANAHQHDNEEYLWFMWLTQEQYRQFALKSDKQGTVPGYKDTHGDTVHKHHRLHNTPDHCINLHIHNRWNAAADNDNYASNKPIYLL